METLSVNDYFRRLTEGFGNGWNRFWYSPSDPLPLCLIRIVTGLFALFFVFSYTSDLTYFFAQGGLLPFELTEQYLPYNAVYKGNCHFRPDRNALLYPESAAAHLRV